MAEKLSVLSRLAYALNRCNFPSFRLKPHQVSCFEYLLKGKGIVAVLHTGKSPLLMCQNILKPTETSIHEFLFVSPPGVTKGLLKGEALLLTTYF